MGCCIIIIYLFYSREGYSICGEYSHKFVLQDKMIGHNEIEYSHIQRTKSDCPIAVGICSPQKRQPSICDFRMGAAARVLY